MLLKFWQYGRIEMYATAAPTTTATVIVIITNSSKSCVTLNSLLCVNVPLRNYSLVHWQSLMHLPMKYWNLATEYKLIPSSSSMNTLSLRKRVSLSWSSLPASKTSGSSCGEVCVMLWLKIMSMSQTHRYAWHTHPGTTLSTLALHAIRLHCSMLLINCFLSEILCLECCFGQQTCKNMI